MGQLLSTYAIAFSAMAYHMLPDVIAKQQIERKFKGLEALPLEIKMIIAEYIVDDGTWNVILEPNDFCGNTYASSLCGGSQGASDLLQLCLSSTLLCYQLTPMLFKFSTVSIHQKLLDKGLPFHEGLFEETFPYAHLEDNDELSTFNALAQRTPTWMLEWVRKLELRLYGISTAEQWEQVAAAARRLPKAHIQVTIVNWVNSDGSVEDQNRRRMIVQDVAAIATNFLKGFENAGIPFETWRNWRTKFIPPVGVLEVILKDLPLGIGPPDSLDFAMARLLKGL